MPRFEVSVPSAPTSPEGVTLRVDAEHWLAALKAGLDRVGDKQPATRVLCSVQADGSLLVTDPRSARMFRISELRAAPLAAPAPARASLRADRADEPSEQPDGPGGRGANEVLADLFDRLTELERHRDRRGGLTFLLDLAIETVVCDAGSVFTAQLAGSDLDFAVARGPRADQISRLRLKVPIGSGIVGFCARENVCLSVSDAQRDPRFHRAISQAIGYDTHSVLCAPMAHEGRVLGALEVLNKERGRSFDSTDAAVLSYLAHRGAEFLLRLET